MCRGFIGYCMYVPAPRLPFRLPMTNLPAPLKTKTPIPTFGSILFRMLYGCFGEKKLKCDSYQEVGG